MYAGREGRRDGGTEGVKTQLSLQTGRFMGLSKVQMECDTREIILHPRATQRS